MATMLSTAQMLQEIESGTAAEIILDSRAINDPFGPTHITHLDECLGRARPHSGGSRLERGDLIELSGPSGSGKTTMLLFLLMTTLLPQTFILKYPNPITIELGGRNALASLIYPTSHRNPLPLLQARMENTVRSAINVQVGHIGSTPQLEEQIDFLVKRCLGRLRVIRIKPRWKDWSLAFKSLLLPRPNSSTNGMEKEEEEGGMDLIICDGFSDGFWAERWADEQLKLNSRQKGRIGVRGGDIHIGDVMDDISRLRKDIGAIVILSVQGLWTSNPGFYTTHLPPPYPNPFSPDPQLHTMNIQISLSGRIKPLQEPSDRTIIESLYIRDSTNERGFSKFEGNVRVVDGLDGMGSVAGGKFRWTVGDQGVHVWEDYQGV